MDNKITVNPVKHNNCLFQYQFSNTFRPQKPSI